MPLLFLGLAGLTALVGLIVLAAVHSLTDPVQVALVGIITAAVGAHAGIALPITTTTTTPPAEPPAGELSAGDAP